MALTGVAWLVLFLVGGVGPPVAGPGGASARTAELLMESRAETRTGIYLNLVGATCALVFTAYLAGRIRRVVDDRLIWLAYLVLAGGVGWVGLFTVYQMLWMAGSGTEDFASHPEVAKMLETLGWEFAGVMTPATAALVGGAGVAILVSGMVPRAMGVLGVLLGAAAVLSGFTGGLLANLAVVWSAILSLMLTLDVIHKGSGTADGRHEPGGPC